MSHRKLKNQICEQCGSKNIDGIYGCGGSVSIVHRCNYCGFEKIIKSCKERQ